MAKDKSDLHWDEIDNEADRPVEGKGEPTSGPKDNLVEYFGADGKDEGPKLMQNADGTWGEAQNAAG